MEVEEDILRSLADTLSGIRLVLEELVGSDSARSHLMSGAAVARYLGCSAGTVTNMRQGGKLNGVRINNRWMYRKNEVMKLSNKIKLS